VNSTASNIREDKHFPGEDICKIGLAAKVSLKNERGRERDCKKRRDQIRKRTERHGQKRRQ
jgi:hypothetical protein